MYTGSLRSLIDELGRLPGIGPKSAQRIAFHILKVPGEDARRLSDAIISVKDEEEAIATANDSAFGLGGGVITRDLARGEHIAAERIESGCVFVNEAVRSDPRLPFGGVKESGYGRELSVYGIKELVNIKTVYVA